MGQQVMDGDVSPGSRAVLNLSADGSLDVQPALRLQHEDRHRRELLGDRTQAEPGLGRIGNAQLTIGGTISPAEKHLTVLSDQDGTAEGLIRCHAVEPHINPFKHARIKDHFVGCRC